jgi:hypothetical protein
MSSLGSFRVPAGRQTGGMPGEFPSSVKRSVKLSCSALDESGSNGMSGVDGKADARSAEGTTTVPRRARTGWVRRLSATESAFPCIPHIVMRVEGPGNCMTDGVWGSPKPSGSSVLDDPIKPKRRGGPNARPSTPECWRQKRQGPESNGRQQLFERQRRKTHPICRSCPGLARRVPAVFKAITRESTRCRRINTP